MEAAKIFESGEGQAAPPPKGFRFEDSEVPAKRQGETLILVPKEAAWQTGGRPKYRICGKSWILACSPQR